MLASVFTPSHDPRWLDAAYKSLRAQSHKEWEWVLVPNGDALRGDAGVIPEKIRSDPRVRVLAAPAFADVGKVGALKRFATSQCRGDVFVELDHDDTLAPTAVARVVREVAAGAGFVYSDFVMLGSDGACQVFDEAWGWETYPARVAGGMYRAIRAFDAIPASLMHVWWAPNHVRAWSRAAYDAAGGHDPDMAVCDDVDLVARTYLAGVEFAHVREPLYVYRMRQGRARNTYLEYNEEIQRLDQQVSNRHFYGLVSEWCRRGGLPMLSITAPGAAIAADEGSVGAIRAYDVMHRVHPEHVPTVMNDFYRVLAPGGWLMLRVPSSDSRLALADPAARSLWNGCSWWFYTRAEYAARVPGLAVKFQESRSWDAPATPWERDHGQSSSHADLCALKGQRTPGLRHI
jgi:SAM-dependent methyltransferase